MLNFDHRSIVLAFVARRQEVSPSFIKRIVKKMLRVGFGVLCLTHRLFAKDQTEESMLKVLGY
jgi:hypothetical protein